MKKKMQKHAADPGQEMLALEESALRDVVGGLELIEEIDHPPPLPVLGDFPPPRPPRPPRLIPPRC